MKLDVKPKPRQAHRVGISSTGRAYVYLAQQDMDYIAVVRELAGVEARKQGLTEPLDEPVHVTILIRRPFRRNALTFGDCDNHAKNILDALRGVIYTDDKHVTELHVIKVAAKENGLELIIKREEKE